MKCTEQKLYSAATMDSDTEADLFEENEFGSDLDFESCNREGYNLHLVGSDAHHRHSKQGIGGR